MRISIFLIALIAFSVSARDEFSFDEVLQFADGFVEALNFKKDLESTKQCIAEVPTYVAKIKALIEKIKKLSFENIMDIIVIFNEIKDLVISIIFDGPCSKIPKEFATLAKSIDLLGLIQRVIGNFDTLKTKFLAFISKLKQKWIRCAGKELGEILVIVFFVVKESTDEALGMDKPIYNPTQAAQRAESLIGKSRSEYVCNQVVNYCYYGQKNYKGYLANTYKGFGQESGSAGAGCAVVAKDGSHVGIISNDRQIIHSSSSKYAVIKVPLSQLKYVFPSGYIFRCY